MIVAPPPANPFSDKKEIRWGKSQKNKAKGFLVGARPPTADRRRSSELHFLLEMGSSFVVKILQNRTFREIAALWGGFF